MRSFKSYVQKFRIKHEQADQATNEHTSCMNTLCKVNQPLISSLVNNIISFMVNNQHYIHLEYCMNCFCSPVFECGHMVGNRMICLYAVLLICRLPIVNQPRQFQHFCSWLSLSLQGPTESSIVIVSLYWGHFGFRWDIQDNNFWKQCATVQVWINCYYVQALYSNY